MSYYVFRDDLSRAKPPASPAMMRTVAYYTVIPEHVNDFIGALKKISEITQKATYASNPVRWYSLASGGDQPTMRYLAGLPTEAKRLKVESIWGEQVSNREQFVDDFDELFASG